MRLPSGHRKRLRPVLASALCALAALSTAASGQEPAPEAAAPHGEASAAGSGDGELAKASVAVSILDAPNRFAPKTRRIVAGDRVAWTNDDTEDHNATQAGGGFSTGNIPAGQSVSRKFAREGTYRYLCTLHPDMKGKIVAAAPDEEEEDDGENASSGVDPASGSGTFPTTTPSSSSTSDFGTSLPATGSDELPLFVLAAGLLTAGLLVGALAAWFSEYVD